MSRAIEGVARGAQDQNPAVTKATHVTDQIAHAIQQVSANAQAGTKVSQANQAGQALEEILGAAREVNQQVTQIAAAAAQMSGLSNELVAATDSDSAVVEENTAATEEMSANSSAVT
jgi:methyl-accepting chemotaxis protein